MKIRVMNSACTFGGNEDENGVQSFSFVKPEGLDS
jgi:hypothetical protein